MRFKSVLYYSPAEIINIYKNINQGERLNTVLLEKHTKIWPYEKCSVSNWSNVINAAKTRLTELAKLYFVPKKKNNTEYEINEYIQQKPITADDKNEIVIILLFLESLFENTTGRTQININDTLCFFAYCIEFEVSLRALYLMRMIMHKQYRSVIFKYNKKMTNLFMFMQSVGNKKVHKISSINFAIDTDDIFELNQKLKNTQVNESDYVKMLIDYKQAKDGENYRCLQYLIADLFLYSRSPDTHHNTSLADMLSKSYSYTNTKNYAVKRAIYDFYIACMEKRYKVKYIYDGLRVRLYDGEFMTELRSIYTKEKPFVKTFFAFITTCLTSKNDALNFITEIGILGIFRDLLNVPMQKEFEIGTVTMKMSISRIIAMILENRYLLLSHTFYENNFHEIFFDEIVLCIDSVPKQDYKKRLTDGSVFDCQVMHCYMSYLRYLLLCIDSFYSLIQTHGSEFDIVDLLESKFLSSMRYMLENNTSFSCEILNHLFSIITNYINAHPLNIVIFEEKDILGILLKVYTNLPKSSSNIIHLIDILNGLSLRTEYLDLIIEKNILRSISMTLLDQNYLECFTITDISSQLGISFEELLRHHPKFKVPIFEECIFLLDQLAIMEGSDKSTRKTIIDELFKQGETYNITNYAKEICTMIPYQEFTKNVLLFLDSLILVDTFSGVQINQIVAKILDLITKETFYYDFDFDFIDLFNSIFGKSKGFDIQDEVYMVLADKLQNVIIKIDVEQIAIVQSLAKEHYTEENKTDKDKPDDLPDSFYDYMHNYIITNRILSLLVQVVDEHQPFTTKNAMPKILLAIFSVEQIFYAFTKYNQIIYFENKPDTYIDESSAHTIKNSMFDFSNEVRYTMLIYRMRNNMAILFFAHIRMLKQREPFQMLIKYVFRFTQFGNENNELKNEKLANDYLLLCFIGNLIENKNASIFPNYIEQLIDYIGSFIENIRVEPEESQLLTKYYDKNDKVIDLRDIKRLNEKLVEVYFYIFKLLMENEMFRLTDKDTERILEYTYKLINMIDCKAYSSEIQKILIFHINDSTKTGLSYESFTKESLELKNHEKVYLSFLAQKYTNDSIFYSKRYYDYLFSINGYKVVNEMQKKNIAGFFAIAQNFKNLGDRVETNAKELRFYKTDFSNEVTNMSDTETEKQEMIVVNILIFYFLCTSYNFDTNTSYKVQEQQKNDQKGNLDRIEKILGAFSSDGADKKRLNFKYKPLQKETSDEVTENMTEKHQNLFDRIYCYNDIHKMTEFACKFTVAEKLLENLNFIIVILRLIEGNIILLTKSELLDMIDFNNLFAQVKQKQCSKTDTLLQLLLFYFAENDGFLTKVVRKIKKTKANLVAHKNILQYRCYPIIKQEMSNDTEEIPCKHTITEEQYKIINLLKRLILSVEYSALALQIFSHLIIYFPYFSAELKEKKFWHKYFNRLVKKEVDKNEINDQNRYGWAVNFAAAIFLRTNNTTVKKIITDTIIKNLTGNNAKNVNYMCKFMTGMLNSKVIINEYACDKECLIKIKPEVPIHETTTQRATTPVTRRRNSQVHSQDLNIEVTEILDELAGRIDSSFSDRIQLVDEPMTTEEQNRLFTRFRSNKPEPINASGSQIVEVFFEKKIPDILLQAIQTSETIPNIVSLLDILSKLRNTNERIDDSDSDLIEFHDSESTTVSEGNEFEDFSAEEEDSEFEDDEEMIDEENEYEDTSLDYYLFDNKPVPSILQRECKFTNLLELWAHEFSTLLKVNEVYFIDELPIDNTIIDFDTTQKVATSTTVTESTDSGNSQEAIVRLPIVANSLVAEEEVCTYQEGCTCIDCISQQSSESSVGEFDGITPELDPVVLNDLPEDLLHEIISNYYDERRTVSTDYQPININFLLTLNDRVRNLFEEYELRFRDDYLLDEKKDEHVIDIPELKIRDKQPIIDTQYINSILKIVQHDLTQKTGLSLLNNICSNANIRKNVMKRLIENLRRDSENSGDDALNSIVNTLKMLGSLLKHQNDYIIYLNVQDINLIFNCGYGKHFSKVYQVLGDILLLITGYDTMKVILQNKELSIEARMKCECTRSLEREKKKAELKESENDCATVPPENRRIEFTDDSNLISIERYYLDTIDLKSKENEKLDKYLSDINFESDVSFYLPNTNVSLSYASDYATMNIMDSNISYFYAKHLNMQYMLSCIEQTTNRDILDYFENIILCTENTFALQYIEFIFTQILAIINRFDFYSDFYNDLNTLYFYFNVISQIRITFNRKEVLEDPQYTISHYFNDCKLAYDSFRERIQKHVFWQSFFVFLETHKEYTMSLLNIFECFCILRKLRYDEDEYKAIVNGDETDEETQAVVNIQENTDVHSGLTLNADSKSNKNTITDNTFDSDNAIKRLKLDAGTKNEDVSGTIEFNNFFRSKVMDYAAFFNRAFEGNISTISKTCDIIPYYNILEFDNKRKYLKHVFKKHGISTIYINVDRNNLVEDSYTQIMNKSGKELRIGKLLVKFSDEEGVDVGGLTREFYMLISKEIVNPDYYLFTQNQDGRTYSINKSSHVNAEHLLFFRFVGRIIAKGIIDNILTDIHFTVPFYKQILGKKLTLSDLMQVDLSFYRSLKWMQENAIEGVVDCSFSLEYDEFGVAKTYDLIENGRNIKVDDNNKHEYIELMANFHMTKNCEKQVQSFNQGFYEVLEKKYVKVFNEKELELLISGLPEIDVDDWRNNTEYHGYKSSSLEIQWFWRCVRGMNNEDKARLLQFVTGTSKLPIEGFKALQGNNGRQRFQIHVGNRGLPCAHTCFNQLDLPKYKNYEEMVDNLLYAIRECSTGFGFA